MRHGFADLGIALSGWFLIVRLTQSLWLRRKAARIERLAADWPVVPGTVSGVSVGRSAYTFGRLTVTYKAALPVYHIENWTHDFGSAGEAGHAKNLLMGWECPVRYNPAREEQTTLMWADVRARLASEPYVPVLKPLTRAGYRWMIAWAALGWVGLVGCLTVYGMAMAGTSMCLCDAEIALVAPSVLVLFGALGIWGRLAMALPGGAARFGIFRVMDVWERWVMGLTALGTVVSVAHFAPMMRAIPKNGNVPDELVAGVMVAVMVPVYLACGLGASKVLRQRKSVAEAVGSAALA